jgi:hypothetical protein
MSENQKPIINLTEHIGNVVFERKDESNPSLEPLTLEEELLHRHREVLKIRVQSVALPPNYNPAPKNETQVIDWLRNRVNNNYSYAYSIALKYGEKLQVKLENKNYFKNK